MLGSEPEGDEGEDAAILVCYRVSSAPAEVKGATKELCFSCAQEVWISKGSLEVKKKHNAQVACIECALEHAQPAEGQSREQFDEIFKKAVEIEGKSLGLGATGNFPRGKINEDDQGELKAALSIKDDKLVLNFGKSVSFLAMTKEEAFMISDGIRKWAEKLP